MTLGENCVRNEPWRNWEKRFEDWIEELKLSIVDGDMEKVKLTFSGAFLVLQSSFTYAASDKTKKGNKIMLRMKNKVINIALINFIAPEYIYQIILSHIILFLSLLVFPVPIIMSH